MVEGSKHGQWYPRDVDQELGALYVEGVNENL